MPDFAFCIIQLKYTSHSRIIQPPKLQLKDIPHPQLLTIVIEQKWEMCQRQIDKAKRRVSQP